MAVTADSVVVELEAKVAGYNAAIADAANKTDAALGKIGKAANDAERSTARIANAQRNLGRQVADVGASLSSGASPFVILGQQAGQVADALADTGGRAAKVAAFFAGPWGAALLAAGSVLGVLAGKAFETGDSVESLVAKLQENAQKAELAAQADRIFSGTQEGLRAQINATTKALADQNAQLRTNAQLRNVQARSESAQAEKAAALANQRLADAQKTLRAVQGTATGNIIGGGAAGTFGRNNDDERLRSSRKAVEEARKAADQARVNLNVSRVFLAREEAIAAATPQGRTNKKFDNLANDVSRTAVAAALRGANVGGTTLGALTAIERQRNAQIEIDNAADSKGRGRKGPSAETLRKRKEAAERKAANEQRRADVNDSRTSDAIADLDARILQSKERLFVGLELQEGAAKAAIDRADADRQRSFDRQRIAGQIDATEQSNLVAKSKELAAQEKLAVSLDFRQRRQAEQDAKAGALLDLRTAQLDAEKAATDSAQRRKEIDLKIIDLRFDELVAAQERIVADTQASDAAKEIARLRIEQLNAERRGAITTTNRQNESQYERYRRDISSSDTLADDIDRIKINTLEAVTDELTNATKAALGLKGAFGDIVGELIRIGIQRRLIGPLADALFGKADGSNGGGIGGNILGSIVGAITGKRASGGNVVQGKPYMVGEMGRELFVPSQSGKIYPTGALNAAAGRGGGPTIVQQSFVLDARGGVVTQDLLRQVNAISSQKAAQAGQAAYENSPSRLAKRETLGT